MRALALAVGLLAVFVASAAGASHTLLPGCGDTASYKPKSVIIACGDGAFRIVKLDWSSWKKRSATGQGTAKVNTCEPNCAAGKFKSYPVKLTADKPDACPNGKRAFSRLTYTFTDKKPKGAKRTEHVPRPCSA
jgi:hypothetical protein